jgi:ubiquitin C-terminal hydrolase
VYGNDLCHFPIFSGHYTAYATVDEEIVYFDDTTHRVVGKSLGEKDMGIVKENVTLVFYVRQ